MIHRLLRKLLKLCLLAIVVVAAFNVVKAHAAEPRPPVPCGSTVAWSVRPNADGFGVPGTARAMIARSWAQVAPVAHLNVRAGASRTVRWEFADWAQGEMLDDGITVNRARVLVDHSQETEARRGNALQSLLLRDILHALGVRSTTSSTTLSVHDRRALTAVCKAEASASSEPRTSRHRTLVSTGAQSTHELTDPRADYGTQPGAAGWTGTAGNVHHIAVYGALVLALLLAAWFALGRRTFAWTSNIIGQTRRALRRGKAGRDLTDEQVSE